METNNKNVSLRRTKTLQEPHFEIRFIPLPQERRPGHEEALRWLLDLMIKENAKKQAVENAADENCLNVESDSLPAQLSLRNLLEGD